MITDPVAELSVRLLPVVFIKGLMVALGSKVMALRVPLTLSFFVGLVVPMPRNPVAPAIRKEGSENVVPPVVVEGVIAKALLIRFCDSMRQL